MELLYFFGMILALIIGALITRAIFSIGKIVNLLEQIRNNLREMNAREEKNEV